MKSFIVTIVAVAISFALAVVSGTLVSDHFFHHSHNAVLLTGLPVGVIAAIAICKIYNGATGQGRAAVQGS